MKKLAILFLSLMFVAGCGLPQRKDNQVLSKIQNPEFNWRYAGKSVEKRKIEYLKLGTGKDTRFFMASIHGNEYQGSPLVMELAKYLRSNPQAIEGKRIIILPETNPDGIALNQRLNAHNVDLNRNFPADNRKNCQRYGFKGLTEPESRAVYKLLKKYKPNLIVALHQAPNRHRSMPEGWFDYDGDFAKELAYKMADACGLTVHKLGSMPGSLGSYASMELKIPIITFEQPIEKDITAEQMWTKYAPALMVALNYSVE